MFCTVSHTICAIGFFSCPKYRFVGGLNQIAYSFFICCVFLKQIFFSIYNGVGTMWGVIQKKKKR